MPDIIHQQQVFISYSSLNRELARTLHTVLSTPPLSYKVWRDERELERDWSAEIANALVASQAVVLLWSVAAAKSRWVLNEWLTARALQKPIVLVMEEGARGLPLPLENMHGMKSSGGSIDPEILQARLKAQFNTPVAYDYTIRSTGVFIPFRSNPAFVGRNDDFVRLFLALIGNLNKSGVAVVGLVGMAGVGKTQLVVEFVYRFSFAFESIYWVTATDESSWLAPFVNLAREIIQPTNDDPSKSRTDREWIEALRTHCAAHPKMLLIIDNVNNPEQLNDIATLGGIAPLELGSNILFTTRIRFNLAGVKLHNLDTLSPEDSYGILSSRRKPGSQKETEDAQAICSALGFLPLALVLAATYLGRYQNISFAFYLQKLRENRLESIDIQNLNSSQLATRHIAAVGATLNSQWEMLSDPNAKQLLMLASQMKEGEVIPKRRLGIMAGIQQRKNSLLQPLEEAMLLMEDLSLAEGTDDGNSFYIHPLIRELIIQKSDDPASIRSSAASRVATEYQSPKSMEEEYAARGLASVLQDLAITIPWSEKGDIENNLKGLRRLLDSESQSIYRFPHLSFPAYFLQQIYTRAFTMGMREFAKEARNCLLKKDLPFFEPLWRTHNPSNELLRTIVEDSHWVNDIICSSDGRIFTANESGSIGIWELETGRKMDKLAGHTKGAKSIHLLEKQNRLISSGEDNTIRLWDLISNQELSQISLELAAPFVVDEDGKRIFVAGEDDHIHVIDIGSFSVVNTFPVHHSASVLCLMPDGIHLLMAHYSSPEDGSDRWSNNRGMLDCWNLKTQSREWTHEVHLYVVDDIEVTKNGESIVTTGRDDKLNIWNLNPWKLSKSIDVPKRGGFKLVNEAPVAIIGSGFDLVTVNLETGKELQRFKGHSGMIKAVDMTADGNFFVSGACDGTARIWNLHSGTENKKTAIRHEAAISCAVVLNEFSATGDMSGELILWENKTGKAKSQYKYWMGPRQQVVAANDGKIIISSSADLEGGTILSLNLETGKEESIRSTSSRVNFLAVNKMEDTLFVDGGAGEVQIDLIQLKDTKGVPLEGRGKFFGSLKTPKEMNWLDGAALTADGNFLLMSASEAFGSPSSVFLFDVEKKELLNSSPGTRQAVQQLAINKGAKQCAFISTRGTLALWQPLNGNKVQVLAQNLGQDPKLAISPNEEFLVSAGTDLCVWDMNTGTLVHRLSGHPGVWHLVVLNERELLTASKDWSVTLWDYVAGKEMGTVGLDSEAREIAVSADGTWIMTGDGAGDVYMFRVQKPAIPSNKN